jgi:hypothetical protein
MINITFEKGEAAYLKYINFKYNGACSFLGQVIGSESSNSVDIRGVQLERLNGWLVRMNEDYPRPEKIVLNWNDDGEERQREYSFKEKYTDNPILVRPYNGNIERIINGFLIEDIVSKIKKFEGRDIKLLRETWKEIADYTRALRKIAAKNKQATL